MSTQADQIIEAITTGADDYAEETVTEIDPDATVAHYQTVDEDTHYAVARRRTVWAFSSGALIAVEHDEGLHKHSDVPPNATAYRVVAREVVVTEYVREES